MHSLCDPGHKNTGQRHLKRTHKINFYVTWVTKITRLFKTIRTPGLVTRYKLICDPDHFCTRLFKTIRTLDLGKTYKIIDISVRFMVTFCRGQGAVTGVTKESFGCSEWVAFRTCDLGHSIGAGYGLCLSHHRSTDAHAAHSGCIRERSVQLKSTSQTRTSVDVTAMIRSLSCEQGRGKAEGARGLNPSGSSVRKSTRSIRVRENPPPYGHGVSTIYLTT